MIKNHNFFICIHLKSEKNLEKNVNKMWPRENTVKNHPSWLTPQKVEQSTVFSRVEWDHPYTVSLVNNCKIYEKHDCEPKT